MCHYYHMYLDLFKNDAYVFECKIPSGTEYYDGVDTSSVSGYASERIVFVKKLYKI